MVCEHLRRCPGGASPSTAPQCPSVYFACTLCRTEATWIVFVIPPNTDPSHTTFDPTPLFLLTGFLKRPTRSADEICAGARRDTVLQLVFDTLHGSNYCTTDASEALIDAPNRTDPLESWSAHDRRNFLVGLKAHGKQVSPRSPSQAPRSHRSPEKATKICNSFH